jgi:hypothetical protein
MSIHRALAVVLLACTLGAIRAGAAAPDPQKLLLYNLLGLDQRELFAPKDYTPLSEPEAWSALYGEMRDKALADASADKRDLKTFLLMGWIARVRNQFGTVEAFNTDFMRLFEARPEETLRVLAEEDFLVPQMCTYLAKFFFFENADPAKRTGWMDARRSRIEAILGADRAKRCLDAFWSVSR